MKRSFKLFHHSYVTTSLKKCFTTDTHTSTARHVTETKSTRPLAYWIFGVSGLAAGFSTLASIFHFQILWALGFFFLTIICWMITAAILDN